MNNRCRLHTSLYVIAGIVLVVSSMNCRDSRQSIESTSPDKSLTESVANQPAKLCPGLPRHQADPIITKMGFGEPVIVYDWETPPVKGLHANPGGTLEGYAPFDDDVDDILFIAWIGPEESQVLNVFFVYRQEIYGPLPDKHERKKVLKTLLEEAIEKENSGR